MALQQKGFSRSRLVEMYNITTKQGDKRGWENDKGNGWSHRIERNRAILRLPKGAEMYSSPSSSDSLVFFSHVSSSSQNKEPLSSAILTEDKRAKRIPAVAVVIVCARQTCYFKMADVEDDEKFLYGGEILLYTPECMLYFLPSVEISVAFSSCLLTLRQINITEFANYSVKSCRTYKVHLRLLSISIVIFFLSNFD